MVIPSDQVQIRSGAASSAGKALVDVICEKGNIFYTKVNCSIKHVRLHYTKFSTKEESKKSNNTNSFY
jgi:hypothetical protein